MRATFISMCAVLILALAACFGSMAAQFRALDRLDALRAEALELVQQKNTNAASAKLTELAAQFDREAALAVFAFHDDLHEAFRNVVDAQVALQCGDWDDTQQALAQLREALYHMRQHEGFSFTNLY